MKKIRAYLLNKSIAPKWAVFLLDLFISVFAIVFAFSLRFNFDFNSISGYDIVRNILLVLIINATLFHVFLTYQGIIRYSGFQESFRSVMAVFYSFFILLIINCFLLLLRLEQITPISVLFVYFFVAAFLLYSYRLLVKYVYKKSEDESKKIIHVIIYGARANGTTLKKTIEQASDNEYKVVAFIDDEPSVVGKTVDGTPVFPFSNAKALFVSWNIKTLFFAKTDFELDEKNRVVDFCINNQIKVMNIPPMKDWIHGHLNIKQLREVKIEELLGRPPINLHNQYVIDHLRDKRILVTGAAGSIGSELARQLAAVYPALLIICDQTESGLYQIEYEIQQQFKLGNALRVYLGDIKDEISIETLFSKYQPQVVFHAAAYKHVPMMENHPSEAIRNNVLGTKVLANVSEKYGVERFLFVSTDKAINPTNVMGASKRIAEIYCQSFYNKETSPVIDEGIIQMMGKPKRTKFITTRFGNVLGSNGSVIPRFKEQIANGGPVTITHPDIIRFFMTIPEACSLVLEAMTMGNGGEIFLFDMGEPVKILDLAKKMIQLTGLIPGKDIELKFTGLRPGEKLFEELLNKEEEVVPTHNKKILIAKVIEYDFDTVAKNIETLIAFALKNEDEEVVKQMKRIVPEYISNNSIYESIDEQRRTGTLYSALSSR
ncbi:MAG: polysaccharide biosynthesis protein [Bacteroidetes bacterium]|nr:polysaccharide biosynthesis protein [Bacteroidota bacterium]MBS1649691.1 polysaccharide biosynthesis protein [Bacteroidota bacterium]